MATTVTLEQVEELVEQMPPQAQLRLVSHITERLCSFPVETQSMEESVRRTRMSRAEAVLALCDAAAERFVGESDAVEEIRQMRDERINQIWQSGA